MFERKFKKEALIALAIFSVSSPASAADEYRYRITVVNGAGENLSILCNGGNPRPVAAGRAHTLTLLGGDPFTVSCSGYDHHGESIASVEAVLEHHHLTHTMVLRRGVHH